MRVARSELIFWIFFLGLTVLIAFTFGQPHIAMWLGFAIAAYSAIGNDSIQTLGTFLTSNSKLPWYVLWAYIGGIFAVTMIYGWMTHNGDISFERLAKIPHPETFTFFHIFAPTILVVLTRYKIPVSTTFLILSVFSTSKTVEQMLTKTLYGYFLAFIAALVFWGILMRGFKKYFNKKLSKKEDRTWRILQWFATAFLWSSWLMQDTANIAVFLPRTVTTFELLVTVTLGTVLIGVILYNRGGKIQEIVTEKKDVTEVRAATLIDFLFAFILVYFKKINNIPMSTTWVFLGLLAGREIILSHFAGSRNPFVKTLYLVAKDILLASIGLLISVLLVVVTRPDDFLPWLKGLFLM